MSVHVEIDDHWDGDRRSEDRAYLVATLPPKLNSVKTKKTLTMEILERRRKRRTNQKLLETKLEACGTEIKCAGNTAGIRVWRS